MIVSTFKLKTRENGKDSNGYFESSILWKLLQVLIPISKSFSASNYIRSDFIRNFIAKETKKEKKGGGIGILQNLLRTFGIETFGLFQEFEDIVVETLVNGRSVWN